MSATDSQPLAAVTDVVVDLPHVVADLGAACVWYYILRVNAHSLTVLDVQANGAPASREIPYHRVSRLLSVGALIAKSRTGELIKTADSIGITLSEDLEEGDW